LWLRDGLIEKKKMAAFDHHRRMAVFTRIAVAIEVGGVPELIVVGETRNSSARMNGKSCLRISRRLGWRGQRGIGPYRTVIG